jgi:hypothetical protein
MDGLARLKRRAAARAFACAIVLSIAGPLAPNVHRRCMTNELALKYLATAGALAGVNRFYARRVLQRCERGEITLLVAAQLMMAAANHAGEGIALDGVATSKTDAVPRVSAP